ncbi:MAG TPA: PKD domain-containing protein [Flavobacteriales bacterium]|nr:PKD domain-containing protein [Flavobacteriales bacterium]
MKMRWIFFRTVLLLIGTAIFGLNSYAQNTTCKTDQIHEDRMLNDPAYQISFNQADSLTDQILASWQFSKPPGVIYLIPLVVHVIHLGEAIGTGTNISLAQINSAVDALNRDFRRLPDDGGIAMGAGVDTEIQFCLKGVNRVDGSGTSNYATSGITNSNEVQIKALSVWDNCCYYNIWTVSEIDGNNGGSGVQGYAYFPGNCNFNKDKDGTVLLYNTFGNDPGGGNGYNLKSYTQLNRVMTHEMGHGLDLYHTFSGGSCSETTCGTQGDLCCDTPPHPGANTNCNTPECGGTQPVNNYMDYTGETCANMFTQCQKDRMRAACAGPRAGLFVAPCGCPPLLALDAGVIATGDPNGTVCGDTICPIVTIKNFGSSTLTSTTINYTVDATPYTFAWTGSLAPNLTEVVNLPCVPVAPGSHTFTSWTSLPNGSPDQDFANDSSTTTFTNILGAEVTLTLTTDNFGYETYWEITDCGVTVLASGGNPSIPPGGSQTSTSTSPGALSSNTTYTEDICLPDGCYCFNIYDDFGDGICCTNGSGSYTLVDEFGNTLASGGSFTVSNLGNNFCVTSVPPVVAITSNTTNICAGDSIAFTDLSTGNPTAWAWTLPGGTPGASTLQNPTITYNTAGTYDVTLGVTNSVTTVTTTFTNYVTVNPNPTLTFAQTNANCGCNGDATVSVASGTPAYTYAWNDSGTQTNANATGLCVGSYSVTVTDANGCTSNGNVSIIETGTFNGSISDSSDISCNGANDGTATVSVVNGTLPYTYTWSNAASTSSISGLSGGVYTVTVTDAVGCTYVNSVTIVNPAAMATVTTPNSSGCAGSCSGNATTAPSGGTGAYSYGWNDPAFQSSATAAGLCAGNYGVTITDANGCTTTSSVTITESSPTTLAMSSGNATCGNPDGSASVSTSGGNSPYTYFWSDPMGQSTATATGLSSGGYTVVIVDVNGCLVTGTVSVNASGGPTASIPASTDASCYGSCDGTATASQSGGVAPFTYTWTGIPTQTTSVAVGLCAGGYQVTVEDANGCSSAAAVIITEPTALATSIPNVQHVSCNGLCDGSAGATATGGTPVYNFVWSTGPTTQNISGLCIGSYAVTVTDANLCTATDNIVITQPPPLTAPTTGSVTVCDCPCAGVVRVFPAGGTPPYTVIWSNGYTDQFQTKLCDGTYDVTVTDANGCVITGPTVVITN